MTLRHLTDQSSLCVLSMVPTSALLTVMEDLTFAQSDYSTLLDRIYIILMLNNHNNNWLGLKSVP